MTIIAAVDGSSLGNPGPGGWAWVVSPECWAAGGWPEATNNIGELTAILELLKATEDAGLDAEPLHVLADSQYAINVITQWRHSWKKRGWQKADKKPIKNLELIQALDAAMEGRDVTFEWVKGHAGHELNEFADDCARECAEAYRDGTQPDTGPGFEDVDDIADISSDMDSGAALDAGDPIDTPATDVGVSLTSVSSDATVDDTFVSGAFDVSAALSVPSVVGDSTSFEDETLLEALPASSGATSSPLPDEAAPHASDQVALQHITQSRSVTDSNVRKAEPSDLESASDITAADVEDLHMNFLRAWVTGHLEAVEAVTAPNAHRIWPDAHITAELYGPVPAQPKPGQLSVTKLGDGLWLVCHRLRWNGGMSVDSAVWKSTDGRMMIVHYQSTVAQ